LIRARCEDRFATSIYSTLGIVVADRLVTPVGWLFSLGCGQPTGRTPKEATMRPCCEQEARDAIEDLDQLVQLLDDLGPTSPAALWT
jgi:hypothetical protein